MLTFQPSTIVSQHSPRTANDYPGTAAKSRRPGKANGPAVRRRAHSGRSARSMAQRARREARRRAHARGVGIRRPHPRRRRDRDPELSRQPAQPRVRVPARDAGGQVGAGALHLPQRRPLAQRGPAREAGRLRRGVQRARRLRGRSRPARPSQHGRRLARGGTALDTELKSEGGRRKSEGKASFRFAVFSFDFRLSTYSLTAAQTTIPASKVEPVAVSNITADVVCSAITPPSAIPALIPPSRHVVLQVKLSAIIPRGVRRDTSSD